MLNLNTIVDGVGGPGFVFVPGSGTAELCTALQGRHVKCGKTARNPRRPSGILKLDFAISRKVFGVKRSIVHVFTLERAKELIYDLFILMK